MRMKRTIFSIFILCILSSVLAQGLLPKYGPFDQIIKHKAYTLKYNERAEQAEWVYYVLTAEKAQGKIKRTDDFREDPFVTTGSATLADYKGSGYDRGHLCPAADNAWDRTAMSESFFMSNMSPQVPGFNRGVWKRLEEQVRQWAIENKEIHVVTAGVLTEDLPVIGPNKVAVPRFYYKVILDYLEPELKGIAFILPNESSNKSMASYAVTIDKIEETTGIDFFHALPDDIEEKIESTMDLGLWHLGANYKNESKAATETVKNEALKTGNDEIYVYITKTGKKYHTATCSYLRGSKIKITLKEAKARGYTACSRCRPLK